MKKVKKKPKKSLKKDKLKMYKCIVCNSTFFSNSWNGLYPDKITCLGCLK